MAFINEYISKEGIKKYRLDDAYLKKHPEYKSILSSFKPSWTIDRERNIYLKQIDRSNPVHTSDYWIDFELCCDSGIFIFRLSDEGSSSNLILSYGR